MPSFPIVDSHVHLYDPTFLTYGWLKSVPKIDRRYDLTDFDRCRGPVQVDKIVFAEVAVDRGLHFAEAAWVQDLADKDSRLAGMIAHAPMEKGTAVAADLDRLAENRILRGIRRLIEVESNYAFCLQPDFIEALNLLPARKLTFDICVKHWGVVFAIELARRCPDVQFVLDHIGKPGMRYDIVEPWTSQIRELSKLPNVVVKLSGVITEADWPDWTRDRVRKTVSHVIDCFGFDRVMYGSDWTVSELSHDYPDWVAFLDELTAGCSESELHKLYRDTAIRIYRL
ncbi:MAG: amidohydrolase family protein [Geminicoccaceae bacterium]